VAQSRVTNTPSSAKMTFFTYRAQLTFGLSNSCKEVNVTALFLQWFEKSKHFLANFSLLPFEEENGHQNTMSEQIPDEAEFFKQYFHNHRVLQHGNLTGMVHFQTSVPWTSLKSNTSAYFTWLKACKVYLNHTKFKSRYTSCLWISSWCPPGPPQTR
jgi:hypothetical protein